ncbi:MAG: sodium-dependent transporter, partial [Helicobacter sp.]|nr:sodium-dependent transporter [Helicobacter sp.]
MTRFSKMGYILATAGSAIGLGGIWKFPYMTGQNGGMAFVLVFAIAFLLFGISIFIIEVLFGRSMDKNPVATFEGLAPQNMKYLKFGGLMILSGVLIFSFYTVVLGWLLHYLFLTLIGLPKTLESTQAVWGAFVSQEIFYQLLWHFIIVALCAYILGKSIKKGIERLNLLLMPLLFLIFLGLLVYSLMLASFSKSFHFLFSPEFSKLNE